MSVGIMSLVKGQMQYWLYVHDSHGLRLFWQRTPSIPWNEVVYVKTETFTSQYGGGYKTIICSSTKKRTLVCCRWSPNFGGLRRYANLLRHAKEHCTHAIIDDKTDFIINCVSDSVETIEILSKDQWVPDDVNVINKCACANIAYFRRTEAKSYLKQALKRQPENLESLELQAIMRADTSEYVYEEVAKKYDKLVSLDPENLRFLRHAALHNLKAHCDKGEAYALRLFKQSDKEIEVSFALSDYYLFKKQYSEARDVLQRLKSALGGEPIGFLDKKLQYATMYGSDVSFRTREKAKRTIGCTIAAILTIALVGFVLWQLYRMISSLTGISK